jgi:hypothetical protein
MIRLYISFALISTLLLGGCGTGAAEKAADQFHQKLDARDYDWIVNDFMYAEDLEAYPADDWRAFFVDLESWGKMKNREQTFGFSTKVNGSITTCKLSYSFDCDLGKIYERLILVDRGEGFKLLALVLDKNEAEADRLTADY